MPFDGVNVDGISNDSVSSSPGYVLGVTTPTTSKALQAADSNVTDAAVTPAPTDAEVELSNGCGKALRDGLVGFLPTICLAALLEAVIACVSMRGSILNADPRAPMRFLLYIRLGLYMKSFILYGRLNHLETCKSFILYIDAPKSIIGRKKIVCMCCMGM